MHLEERLVRFKGTTNEKDLYAFFNELAQGFLYGGYIQVRNEYRIYVRTVEFYFHSEELDGIHDPIIYHRNIRDKEGNILEIVPYFPIMSLHAHSSGYDITFESEVGKYRSSSLIRSYEVKDKDGRYLLWDAENGMFLKSEKYGYNTQSTYLYYLLNGFPLGISNNIKWVDAPIMQKIEMEIRNRKNVFKSKNEYVYEKIDGERCERPWSFTRTEPI